MTKEQFINQQIAVWGEDYIFDLLDRGYELQFVNDKWCWVAPIKVRSYSTNS